VTTVYIEYSASET